MAARLRGGPIRGGIHRADDPPNARKYALRADERMGGKRWPICQCAREYRSKSANSSLEYRRAAVQRSHDRQTSQGQRRRDVRRIRTRAPIWHDDSLDGAAHIEHVSRRSDNFPRYGEAHGLARAGALAYAHGRSTTCAVWADVFAAAHAITP